MWSWSHRFAGTHTIDQVRSVDHLDLVRLTRRLFPRARSVSVEAASERQVVVYRARVDGAVFYLRVAEQPGQDLTTDAQILERLGALGARVPAVVAAEAAPAEVPLSCMIVTEIPGRSVARAGTPDEARRAARLAGRDTALINSVTVAGFGWVQRNGAQRLTAELDSYGDFVVSYLPETWPGWLAGIVEPDHLAELESLLNAERHRPLGHGCLAHGDLDLTHIYIHDGAYSGIIDFGEMRGAEPEFDLGHFQLHDGESRPMELFDSFLAGYAEVAPLADDHREAIRVSAILLGLRQLSLWLGPLRNNSPTSWLARLRVAELANLLEHKPAAQPRTTSSSHPNRPM
jgi:aminoglycoside phosphotransferase (APT) family kinase protein